MKVIQKLKCLLLGHSMTQHTYGSGVTYTGKHCWRCKKGLPASAHGYEALMKRNHRY